MFERKQSATKFGGDQRGRFSVPVFKHFLSSSRLFVILFILLVIPTDAFSQVYPVFNVQSIIKEVKLKYQLTLKEVKFLLPLIKQENLEILVIYARFGENENGYSEKLWTDIIVRRSEFETRVKGKLTARQLLVLRAVRTEMEKQILTILVEDYVVFLEEYLLLDRFQLDSIDKLLFQEYKRKHQLIIRKLSNLVLLRTELEKINRESESEMEKILSTTQFRLYLMLWAEENAFITE